MEKVAENEHVRISINDEWVQSMFRKVTAEDAKTSAVGSGGGVGEPTIFRVPTMIRRSKPADYKPRIISLGPYHHGKHNLAEKDDLKYRYLNKFLKRFIPKDSQDHLVKMEEELVRCLKEMKGLEERTRKAYSDSNEMSSDDFVGMMLLDGSVVIETLLFWGQYDGIPEVVQKSSSVSTARSLREVARDMLLLENQLPFFLLQTLFGLIPRTSGTIPERTLIDVTHSFACTISRGDVGEIPSEEIEYHHILHFLHSCIIAHQRGRPTGWLDHVSVVCLLKWLLKLLLMLLLKKNLLSYQRQQNHQVMLWIPCATQLKEAGIRFGRKKQAKSFIDVTFKDGEMEIPRLIVDDQTNVLFRNLIAFEQCCSQHDDTPVTSYAFLMDCIINTADDIVLLQKDQIIINSSGDNKEVADFFNNLCKDVPHNNHKKLVRIFDDVNKHCGIRYKKWWASLRHLHFKNPWTIIGLLAAIFLFVLGTVQTVYTVLSYVRPKN